MPQPSLQQPDNQNHALSQKESLARWFVEINESPESENWLLEIDSPHVYVTVDVSDIATLDGVIRLLDSALVIQRCFDPKQDEVALGLFNGLPVHLIRDNEDFPRCFIIVGPQSGSVLRVSLDEENIRALRDALHNASSAVAGTEGNA